MNLAILASYNGSAMQSILDAIEEKKLPNCHLKLVISNNADAQVLQKAKQHAIKSHLINAKIFADPDEALFNTLTQEKIDIIFLAGYMKKLSPKLTQSFQIINSHPALLPKFGGKGMYGRHVHNAVIAHKEKRSGVTVHEVNENYDEGTILIQKSFLLHENETSESLEKRIKELEKTAIVEGLALCLK